MGLNKLFALAAALTVLAASTGQLPRIIRAVHLASSSSSRNHKRRSGRRPRFCPSQSRARKSVDSTFSYGRVVTGQVHGCWIS